MSTLPIGLTAPDFFLGSSWFPTDIVLKGGLNRVFRFDALSITVATLVVFVGVRVLRFARTYLEGDPKRRRAMAWMACTLLSVMTLVLANHLLLLWGAWVATSLSLHRLLLHFPERPGAIFAARKKFVVSRLADLCVFAGALWLYRSYGTLQLDALFQRVNAGGVSSLPGACLLFVAGAALKSAQFPFHSWLPDTMEAPTPVSALMHAGVINAGGFLILRLYPLFQHVPSALATLTVIGVVSAGFGALVMTTQSSVKRALAFSTIAQMGYLFLQCGIGAPALALLHLVAHALYKAHAFLHSGSTIEAPPRTVIPLKTSAIVLGMVAAGCFVVAKSFALDRNSGHAPLGEDVLGVVLALALAYGFARATSLSSSRSMHLAVLGVALAFAALNGALHLVASSLLGGDPMTPVSPALAAFVLVAFVMIFAAQVLLWRASRTRWGRILYVHALNGFYIGTYANRSVNRLWPRSSLG